MTLQEIGSVGEAVGAIGVLVSLVYLALQIRQNTRATRAAAFHEGASAWAGWLTTLAGDPELTGIYFRGRSAIDSLPLTQRRRFELLLDAMLSNVESYFIQHRYGTLDPANQKRFESILRLQLQNPGVREYWERRKALFTEEFAAYVDRECLGPPLEGAGETPAEAGD